MLTLYFAPGSSSMAAHIALREVGAEFEARAMSFHRGDMRSPEYLALNPAGKVPMLLVDGRPLTEVAGILFYIARRFTAFGLLPEGAEEAAHVVSWMSFAASTLHPARRQGLEHAISVYRLVDRHLAGRDWLAGAFSIADIHVFRLFWRLNAALRPAAEVFPNLLAHHARMLERPAVRRVIADEAAIGYELPG